MKLTPVERERITDSMLKIQSVRASLDEVDEGKIPNVEEIESCLESADHSLKIALGYARSESQLEASIVPDEEDKVESDEDT
jgi:hypothetical protein